MAVKIPFPIPAEDRARLMAAGKHALEAWTRDLPDTWRQRHARVEQIIAHIIAKYGVEEDA